MEASTLAQSYVSSATCHLIDETDDEETIAVHLPNGFFVVLSPLRILSCCNVGVKDVSKILIFHTCESYCKHYLLVSMHSLIIVSYEKSLKVVKVIDNYSKFLIGDCTGSGEPQLRVWLEGQLEPITVNVDNKGPVSSESPVTYALHRRLQLLKIHLEKERKKLYAKQCLRKKSVEQSFCQNFSTENDSNLSYQNILCVKTTWQRIHRNKWLLGAVVRNTSKRPLSNIYLCAKTSTISTSVLTKSSQLPSIHPNNTIRPEETAYIVGELNPPPFIGKSGSLDLNVAFVCQPDGQRELTVGSAKWNLRASQVVDGSLMLFKDNLKDRAGEELATFCAIANISVGLDIRCSGILNEGASVHDLLERNICSLGFKGVAGAKHVILISPSGGILLKQLPSSQRTRRDRCRILLRAVEAKESLLLIRALQDVFPDKVEVSVESDCEGGDAAALAASLTASLTAELKAIQTRKPRLDIAPLELETDLAMNKLNKAQQPEI